MCACVFPHVTGHMTHKYTCIQYMAKERGREDSEKSMLERKEQSYSTTLNAIKSRGVTCIDLHIHVGEVHYILEATVEHSLN